MEILNKDMLYELAKRLDFPSLIRLLSSSKQIKEKVSKSSVWMYKLIQDFPDYKSLNIEDLKECYILLYQLTMLKTKLKENKFVEQSIYEIYNTPKLYLYATDLSFIPKEIGKLRNLRILGIFNNDKLYEIPKEICNLQNLQSLDLSVNKLLEIPKEIGNLSNLQSLDLSVNQLRYIPKEIGKLSNLYYLNLYNNYLTLLPKEIGKLTNLQKLYLTSNQLKEIPEEIRNIKSLQINS